MKVGSYNVYKFALVHASSSIIEQKPLLQSCISLNSTHMHFLEHVDLLYFCFQVSFEHRFKTTRQFNTVGNPIS
jgi:hypothetical protein